ncbi:MAG: hypothetical protein JXR97_16915 [Planctomycetes bacterium]|nr:hypothetical protein [Planctomycetota bacterium]
MPVDFSSLTAATNSAFGEALGYISADGESAVDVVGEWRDLAPVVDSDDAGTTLALKASCILPSASVSDPAPRRGAPGESVMRGETEWNVDVVTPLDGSAVRLNLSRDITAERTAPAYRRR